MVRRFGFSQIGFFSLNGSRAILGLTLLGIVDGLFSFRVSNFVWDSSISPSVLALLLAFIIAGASLLGVIIGELLENIIVAYWRGFYSSRLDEIKSTFTLESQDTIDTKVHVPKIKIFRLFFNGEMWRDHYFLPYRQAFLTRFNLVFTSFLIVYSLIFISTDDANNDVAMFFFKQSNVIIVCSMVTLLLLFLSIRLNTDRNRTKMLKNFFLKDIPIPIILCSMVLIFLNLSLSSEIWILVIRIVITSCCIGLIVFTKWHSAKKILKGLKMKSEIKGEELFEQRDIYMWQSLIGAYYLFLLKPGDTRATDHSRIPDLYLSIISGVYLYKAIYSHFTAVLHNTGKKSIYGHTEDFNRIIDLVEKELVKENFETAFLLFTVFAEGVREYTAELDWTLI